MTKENQELKGEVKEMQQKLEKVRRNGLGNMSKRYQEKQSNHQRIGNKDEYHGKLERGHRGIYKKGIADRMR